MRVGIIGGAGLLGSTIAFNLAMKNIVDELVLIDIKENLAKSHVMDMGQAISELNSTIITSAGWDGLSGCDIVIMTASMPERQVKSRVEFLTDNLKIVRDVAGHLVRYCPNAAVVNGTNPVDPFNYIFHQLTGMPSEQFVGFSRNDTLRFRWAIAKVLGVSTMDVKAMVIGEHGEAQVPLFSTVTVKGEKVVLTNEQKNEADALIKTWFTNYQALQSGRTSGWTSALGVGHLVEAMVKETGEMLACSAILNGQYGIVDVSVGAPVILGPKGIAKVVEMPLATEENQALKTAASKMKDILDSVSWR